MRRGLRLLGLGLDFVLVSGFVGRVDGAGAVLTSSQKPQENAGENCAKDTLHAVSRRGRTAGLFAGVFVPFPGFLLSVELFLVEEC